MKDEQKVELQELQNLETAGSIDDSQLARLGYLKDMQVMDEVAIESKKNLESALAQKEHFRSKAEKEEADKKILEQKLKDVGLNEGKGGKPSLDIDDYIDISASLEGLDQKEKEKLAREHTLSGKSLSDIRKDEDFILWQTAYREKAAKELALKPSSTQTETDKPTSLEERLASATSMADKEKILTELGLYAAPKLKSDRHNIGPK